LKVACEQHPSVQLLIEGRRNIGEPVPEDWLEVKSAGNQAFTIKTRMDWLGWNGETVSQAMVGIKKQYVQFSELVEMMESRGKRFQLLTRLNRIDHVVGKDTVASDITAYHVASKVDTCPDWKRLFHTDGTSRPYADMREYHRLQVERHDPPTS
jgi:hypothetical protein